LKDVWGGTKGAQLSDLPSSWWCWLSWLPTPSARPAGCLLQITYTHARHVAERLKSLPKILLSSTCTSASFPTSVSSSHLTRISHENQASNLLAFYLSRKLLGTMRPLRIPRTIWAGGVKDRQQAIPQRDSLTLFRASSALGATSFSCMHHNPSVPTRFLHLRMYPHFWLFHPAPPPASHHSIWPCCCQTLSKVLALATKKCRRVDEVSFIVFLAWTTKGASRCMRTQGAQQQHTR